MPVFEIFSVPGTRLGLATPNLDDDAMVRAIEPTSWGHQHQVPIKGRIKRDKTTILTIAAAGNKLYDVEYADGSTEEGLSLDSRDRRRDVAEKAIEIADNLAKD